MEQEEKPHIAIRLFTASILCFFAFVPIYVGVGVLWQIIQDPPGTPAVAMLAIGICGPLAYFLLLLAWRAFTWRSSRRDRGLLPPVVMQGFALLYGSIVIFGIIGNFFQSNYIRSALGIFFLFGAIFVFYISSQRRKANKVLKTETP